MALILLLLGLWSASAAELPPPGAIHQQAAALRAEGRPEKALRALGRRDDPRAHLERARALRDMGRLDTALAEVDASLRKLPSVEAWSLRALIAGMRGDEQGAAHALDRVATLVDDPDELAALVDLARMLTGLERTRLALLRWTERHPTAPLLRELARAHVDLDELEMAASAIERAARLDSGAETLLLQAEILDGLEQRPRAHQLRRMALSEARHRLAAAPDDEEARAWVERAEAAVRRQSRLDEDVL